MQTLKSIRSYFFDSLNTVYSRSEIDTIFYWCIEEYCNISKVQTIGNEKFEVSNTAEQQLNQAVEKLQQNTPIQYILQKAWFGEYCFEVSPAVLIPRPETEELVLLVSLRVPKVGAKILEIGTGSGCIAISLDKRLHEAKIHACDISIDALKIAKNNATTLQSSVHFFEMDIFKWNETTPQPQDIDCVVSNPPYICQSEETLMKNNVLKFEPHTALFVPDNDPLLFYRTIAACAKHHLKHNGILAVEINERFGNETAQLFSQIGFHTVQIHKDLFGKDRMVSAVK